MMKENFDEFAQNYRNIHTDNIKHIAGANSLYFAKHKVEELKRLEKDGDMSILDVGCGDGTSAKYMAITFPESSIYGIDISNESIAIANRDKAINCTFLNYNGSNIPFPDNNFQIIFIAGVLHHVPVSKRQGLMNEIARVLQVGGRLYLFEHNPYNPLTRHLVNTCKFDEGVKLITPRQIKKLVFNAGSFKVHLHYILFFPRYRIFRALFFIEKYFRLIPLGGQYFYQCIKG